MSNKNKQKDKNTIKHPEQGEFPLHMLPDPFASKFELKPVAELVKNLLRIPLPTIAINDRDRKLKEMIEIEKMKIAIPVQIANDLDNQVKSLISGNPNV